MLTSGQARSIEYTLVGAQVISGLLHRDPSVWYTAFITSFFTLMTVSLGSAAAFQVLCIGLEKCGLAYLIQTSKTAQPTRWRAEITDTVLGFGVVVSAMIAWPVANHQLGLPTAMRDSLEDCVPAVPSWLSFGDARDRNLQVGMYLIKMIGGILIADAYNYWKHRYFHHKVLWPFHKVHHSHHNPSALGGYAISPMFGFATFLPIYLFTLPELGLYVPLHGPLLIFYFLLNHYLHCGYVIPAIEKILHPCYIMTSQWHNVHHEKGRMGFDYKPQTFGEMLSLWDVLCGTHAQGHYEYAGSKKTT